MELVVGNPYYGKITQQMIPSQAHVHSILVTVTDMKSYLKKSPFKMQIKLFSKHAFISTNFDASIAEYATKELNNKLTTGHCIFAM